MIIKALILTVATSCSAMLAAQNSNGLSMGAEAAHPLGSFGVVHGFGYGATAGVELVAARHIGLFAQAGFIRFSGSKSQLTTGRFPAFNTVPLQVGAKFHIEESHRGLYLGVMGGLHITAVEGEDTDTRIGAAPLIGAMVSPNVDLSFRYQMLLDTYQENGTSRTSAEGYLGLRIAYIFNFRGAALSPGAP